MRHLLGIDIGGSGSRVALAGGGAGRTEFAGDRIGITAAGSTVPDTVIALVRRALAEWPAATEDLAGVGVGATGLATLVERPDDLVADVAMTVATATGHRVGVAIAVDAVTAHLGALGGDGGVIVALGTGAIALGTDGRDIWRRVDGWGHLLGDRGAGAWIGMQGLGQAMRAYDGVDATGAVLLDAARRRFGEPLTWPGQLYTRADRAGVLASFAADVVSAAADGDASSTAIVVEAGREAARSAAAALHPGLPPVVATTGGMFRAAGALTAAFAETLSELRPDAALQTAVGDPLDGALILAERAASGAIDTHTPYVWVGY